LSAELGAKNAEYENNKLTAAQASIDALVEYALKSNDDQARALLEKFAALEDSKAELVKAGTAEQVTDVQKQLANEVDALKKMFEGVNLGTLLGGGEGAASAVGALSDNLDRLSNKLAAVKAMDAASEQSGFLARMASYRAEAAELNAAQDKTASTLKKIATAAADGAASLDTNTTKLRSQIGAGAGALSQLGQAFAQVVPEVAGFQTAIDTGLRSLGGMLGVIGGGPGILLGGLVAGLGVLGAVMSSTKKDAAELAKGTDDAANSFVDYIAKINQEKQRAASFAGVVGKDQTAKQKDYGLLPPIEEVDTEIEAIQRSLKANQDEIQRMSNDTKASFAELQKNAIAVIPAINSQNEALRERLGILKEHKEELIEEFNLQQQNIKSQKEFNDTIADYGTKGKNVKEQKFDFNEPEPFVDNTNKYAARRDLYRQRSIEALEGATKIRDMQLAFAEKEVESAKAADKLKAANEIQSAQESIEAIKQKYEALRDNQKGLVKIDLDSQAAEMQQEIGDAMDAVHARDAEQVAKVEEMRRSAWQESHDLFLSLESDKASQVQLNIQKEKSDRAQVTQSLMALGTTAAQLTAKQLEEAVKGHKVQAAMILEGIGDAMVAEGVRVMFQGGAALLMGNYASGGGLLALGAAEIGVGLGLGAAGAAATPPSATGDAGKTTSNSSPIRDNQQTSNDSQRGPTVIYIDMPTVVSPTAEDGMRVRQAMDRASLVYGAPV
jgi:hypothetical protein